MLMELGVFNHENALDESGSVPKVVVEIVPGQLKYVPDTDKACVRSGQPQEKEV
jgi:hypothetical protein